jgi:ribonucleoside-diphosphate reductase alpha chain
MFATPVLSNGGLERGLPISCFLSYVPDSLDGIFDHWAETGYLSASGGGVGGYWGHLRSSGEDTSRGSKSGGSIPFQKVIDVEMLAVSQGTTRRGSYATYTDISHPEIEEFIVMRKPSGGDEYRKTLNLHHAVNIPDRFMEIINDCMSDPDADDSWPLVDPNSGRVVKTVSAKALWQKLLDTRHATGEPFLHFVDASNRALPQPLKDKGLVIHQSNLCTEIFLPTSPDRTAVCCLSSVNAAKYDEWAEDDRFVEDLMRMLDNVLTNFIERCETDPKYKGLWRAVNSAKNERSVGLGLMGFHTLLQQKMIPFESPMAEGLNRRIFRQLDDQSLEASRVLAEERGEAPDMAGTGERFAHRLAVAPNASSSIICGGVSPSIEPMRANAYVEKTLSGSHLKKNPVLEKLLRRKAEEEHPSEAITLENRWWNQIIEDQGSALNLDCLDDHEKEVFKTAIEIDQMWVINHAGARGGHICQGQSVNIFLPKEPSVQELHALHFYAWQRGLKSLYYCRSESIARPENIEKKIAQRGVETPDCIACEG